MTTILPPLDNLKKIGVELRANVGFSDSVQQAIAKEGRFKISRQTSFYVFQLKRFPDFIKPGIAIDPEHRAGVSDDEYGDLLLELMFDSREEAFFMESAVLSETISFLMCPKELESVDWAGHTEVRLMDFEQIEPIVDFYTLELENLNKWRFAAEYVPMTSDQRKVCNSSRRRRLWNDLGKGRSPRRSTSIHGVEESSSNGLSCLGIQIGQSTWVAM